VTGRPKRYGGDRKSGRGIQRDRKEGGIKKKPQKKKGPFLEGVPTGTDPLAGEKGERRRERVTYL